MSATLLTYLRTLFGRDDRADCVVRFYLSAGDAADAQGASKRLKTGSESGAATPSYERAIGDPLPAHLFILGPGSAYFNKQADSWSKRQNLAGTKPVLRVPLGSASDLQYARAAIRFIYTGTLDGIDEPSGLLRVRRMAGTLQIAGGVAACDAALLSLVNPDGAARSATSGSPLRKVVELYACRDLLPVRCADEHSATLLRRLFRACREQLSSHFSTLHTWKVGGVPVKPGEVLGWAFRDAPSLLSDPEGRLQMQTLPAAAMEALLGSDTFATDNEASVLLMLAEWLVANPSTPRVRCDELCGYVRLSQLSEPYLFSVLPELSWFPIKPQEHRFLCQYATADAATRAKLAAAMKDKVDCSTAWYSSSPRPQARADATKAYEWSFQSADIKGWRVSGGIAKDPVGSFANGSTALVANGFEWRPMLSRVAGEKSKAGIFLLCSVPDALRIANAQGLLGAAAPGAARLTVHRWRDGDEKEVACRFACGALCMQIGGARGFALPGSGGRVVKMEEGAAFDPVAPCAAFLDAAGKLTGTLMWS